MYEPNYAKIQAQQDAEASIMAANLFQLAKEQTRAEIVERRKDKVKQLGDDIVETIKACFWRGFYNGTQDAKTDITALAKQKGKKADLASTFSFSNFMTNVIEFEESEEEKLRKEIAEIEKKLGKFRGLSGKTETPLQKQLREKKKQLAQITPVKLIDEFMDREQNINRLKADIKRIQDNPGYAANVRQMQDEIKGLQRSNAKIRKEVPNIGELAAKRLVAKAVATEEAPKKKSRGKGGKNKLLPDVPDVKPSLPKNLRGNLNDEPKPKPKRERIRNDDPRVQAILTPEIRDILAKSEIERTREEQVKLNKAEIKLEEFGKSFKTITSVTQRRQSQVQVQTNKYRIERDRLEQLAQQAPVGYNPKKDKPEQALKRSIYRMEDKRNRERFITLNTEYPSLFDNYENNSFFARYLNQRALTISDGLKKIQEADIKSRVVGFASDTGVSGKGVIELIQKNLKDPKQAVAVDRLSKRIGSKREGLRLTNEQYLERYQEWTNKATKAGSNQAETLKDPNEKRFATLIAKEQKGVELSDAEFEELDNLESSLSQRRQDEIANLITQPTEKLDAEKLAKLKQLAKDNPKGLANFDRKARATLTLPEIQALKNTIGEKAYNWATNKAEVGPNGELRLNSAHLLKLQEKLDQVSLNNDTKLMQRATSIATTEISAAYNLGRLQVYLDNGVRYVQYTATLDDKTTVFCQSLHMKVYPLNELLVQSFNRTFFPNTDEPEYSPSNRQYAMKENITFWLPPAHFSCRSFLLPIYTDDVKDKIEQNDLAKKYKLEVSKEIATSQAKDLKRKKSASWNSIARDLKDKGTLTSYDDDFVQKIIRLQSKRNEFLTRKTVEDVGDFADLFSNGYRFIVNKIREKGTRFEDGKLILDPEDVKKNDRSLTTLLLSSGMVLGFGAMLYFFTKSNLAGSLRNYLGIKLGKKAADATAAEVATALGAIDSVINNIPEGLRDQLVDEATPDKQLPDLSKIARTPDPAGELVALAKQTQSIEDYVAVLNSLSEEDLVSLLGASGLTPLERRRVGVQAVVNRINQNINGSIVPQYDAIVKAALGNNKGLAGGLDLRNVREIQKFSPDALQVKFKPGFGSPTLLSKRRLETALGALGRREILQQMQQEVAEEIALLDQWAESLKIGDAQSAIERALIIKTRKELAEIQAGLEGFANNFEYFRNVDYDALPAETWGDVAAQFGTAAKSEVERASLKLYENQGKLDALANRLRSDFDSLREFDPDTYGRNFFENFNIDSFRQNLIGEARQELDSLLLDPLATQEDIDEFRNYLRNLISNPGTYELPELKALDAQVDNAIKQVNTKYVGQNRPYELRIAARRLPDGNGEAEYNIIRQSIEEASNVMRVYGEGENVSPVVRNINEGYTGYIESRYNQMLNVQQQIKDRIKELESNNQGVK